MEQVCSMRKRWPEISALESEYKPLRLYEEKQPLKENVFLNNNQKRSKYDDRWSQCNAFQCLVRARNYSITIQLKRDAYNIYLEISYDTHLIHTRAAILLVVENMTD